MIFGSLVCVAVCVVAGRSAVVGPSTSVMNDFVDLAFKAAVTAHKKGSFSVPHKAFSLIYPTAKLEGEIKKKGHHLNCGSYKLGELGPFHRSEDVRLKHEFKELLVAKAVVDNLSIKYDKCRIISHLLPSHPDTKTKESEIFEGEVIIKMPTLLPIKVSLYALDYYPRFRAPDCRIDGWIDGLVSKKPPWSEEPTTLSSLADKIEIKAFNKDGQRDKASEDIIRDILKTNQLSSYRVLRELSYCFHEALFGPLNNDNHFCHRYFDAIGKKQKVV